LEANIAEAYALIREDEETVDADVSTKEVALEV
jgi:hypothetical protein